MTNRIPRHVFRILVDNEPGTLDRVVVVFSGKGHNIESLNVAEVDVEKELSLITIITEGDGTDNDIIKARLNAVVPVHHVEVSRARDLAIEREFALIKLENPQGLSDFVQESLPVQFHVQQLETQEKGTVILQCAGKSEEINDFVKKLMPFGVKDISRTGLITVEK